MNTLRIHLALAMAFSMASAATAQYDLIGTHEMDIKTFVTLPLSGDPDNDGQTEFAMGRFLVGPAGQEANFPPPSVNTRLLDLTGDNIPEVLVMLPESVYGTPAGLEEYGIHRIRVYQATGSVPNEAVSTLPNTSLGQNYPNPAEAVSRIPFTLAIQAEPEISIYDALGRLVTVLRPGLRNPGPNSVTWDARDRNGTRVAAGTYFYELSVGDQTETKKMIVIQ